VRSVSGLDGLVNRSEVGADADVDVLLGGGDLRFVHDQETTAQAHLCQAKLLTAEIRLRGGIPFHEEDS